MNKSKLYCSAKQYNTKYGQFGFYWNVEELGVGMALDWGYGSFHLHGGLWQTPKASMPDNFRSNPKMRGNRFVRQTGSDFGLNLADEVKVLESGMWPAGPGEQRLHVNGLTWDQVAAHIGGGNTGDSVRKMHDRFLKGGVKAG